MGDVAFGAFREDAVLLFEAGLLMPRGREAGGPTGTIREPRKHSTGYAIRLDCLNLPNSTPIVTS
jgi:hypothetical protein